jgi:hypothetical protein
MKVRFVLFGLLLVTLIVVGGVFLKKANRTQVDQSLPSKSKTSFAAPQAASTTISRGAGVEDVKDIDRQVAEIPPQLIIGRTERELYFATSTRYTSYNRYVELNEIRAVDLLTKKVRSLESLPAEQSYTKMITGSHLSPTMTASFKEGVIRVEVYFMATNFFPNQERLPIEIHTISVDSQR